MSNRVITISREAGSGGRTIGRKVAEKLGIPCYDAELIEKIAEESGYSDEYVRSEGEGALSGWFSNIFSNRAMGPTNQDRLWVIQSRVITELAEKGPCVIVGRCADYVLRSKADTLNVFIHANPAKRAERIVREYGEINDRSPLDRIQEKDRRRAAYHRFYTDMKWGQSQNYHICLDSGKLGIDKCAEIIASLF
ncbi:MAG: AAA family ATPase [Bullifex sp.]